MIKTHEKSLTHEFSLDHHLEMFSKAGSLFVNRRSSYYGNEETALSLFQKAWSANEELAFKLLLWMRDARGGAGNRSGFRECIKWLATCHNSTAKWVVANIHQIPDVGRFDDLQSLFNTPIEYHAAQYWANAIKELNVLAAKWADRKDKPIKHALGIKEEGKFRKLLAGIRKNHIVEHKMSTRRWNEIEYHTIPSLAMARYTNSFKRHDEERFNKYKENLAKGEQKINANVLFPHDCIRTAKNGDKEIANAQFEALPNYMEGTEEKIIVLSDTSGSMNVSVSGSISACDISQGLALYCSAKIPANNPFHKKFIGFCSEGKFKNWNDKAFSETIYDRDIFDRAIGSTRIDLALNLILETAKFFNLAQNFMPTMLLIVSDMQFHSGVKGEGTQVELMMQKFENAGYKRPKIVYWNTSGYVGSPDTKYGNNIGLVSGFSPSILRAILGGDDFSPIGIMMRALGKYSVVVPQ